MDKKQTERYVRWQNYRITQLSYTINLFLVIGISSLAYAINLKVANTLSSILIEQLQCSIYWWSASTILGSIASVSRLLDFRYTARKIKHSNPCDKEKAKFFGKVTWSAMWGQIITYIIGGYMFINNVVLV